MTVTNVETAARTVEHWRISAGADNPAGPLFASGAFAESDIIEAETSYTGHVSICSASHTISCC